MIAGTEQSTADLRWNIWIEGTDRHQRSQYGDQWIAYDAVVAQRDGAHLRPAFDARGALAEDLLVVTSLPRSDRGTPRIISLGGTHGPATDAARLLLDGRCTDLDRLVREIDPQHNPYFQAVFSVDVTAGQGDEVVARGLQYVTGQVLDVRFATS